MIDILTKGIGAELWKPVRISYYNLLKILEKDERYFKSHEETKLFLVDVLALSIFNQKVILPLHGASNFVSGTKKLGVKQVGMGSYHLDRDFFRTSTRITRQFFAIVSKYKIDPTKLHVSSISEFLDYWLRVTQLDE